MESSSLVRKIGRPVFIALCVALSLLFTWPGLALEKSSQRVLVLHSYHPGLHWTDSINSAIAEVFAEAGTNLQVHVEFLDTKRYLDRKYQPLLDNLLQYKLAKRSFDILLLSDNDALNFALKHRNDLFQGIPIVFCGINNFQPSMLSGFKAITGIAETVVPRDTVELALRLHPGTEEIVAINSTQDVTGRKIRELFLADMPSFQDRVRITLWDDLPVEELQARLKRLPPGRLVFLNGILSDRAGRVFSYVEGIRKIKPASPVPLYGYWDFFLGQGIVGGKLISGTMQGRLAACLALRILGGENPDDIAVIYSGANAFMFDYSELKRFGIPLKMLPENSTVINKPPPFYKISKIQLWAALVLMAGLTAVIGILIMNVFSRRKAEKALRQSEERMSAILEQLPHGVGVFDTEGRFILTNSVMRGYVGSSMPSRDPVRQERWNIFDAEGRPVPPENWPCSRALRGEAVFPGLETIFTDENGCEHWTLLSAVPFRAEEGQITGIITVAQDITARRQAEEALREAKAAAEEASRAKSEFLANMSHEIRTPMTVFMSAIEHLLQIDRDSERRHLLGMADQSARRLRSLIDDILDFSRIEARKVEIEKSPFDLWRCVREAVEMFAFPAREKGLLLEVEIEEQVPRLVLGDSDRLDQILINLVGNAVKFTHEGEIHIRVRSSEGAVEFAVADTGIGIPKEKRALLFESFSQIDTSFSRRYGGTGLGLAISKGLVELMGGEISVEGREGKGSVFTFTLPLEEVKAHTPSPAESKFKGAEESSITARILLAEDDPLIRKMVTMMLAKKGMQITIAETGREALEKWAQGSFDLIFMDLQMPEMNGLEATRSIREMESKDKQRTWIIGLTAHAQREIREECLNAGMDRVMTKPVQMKDLFSTVEAFFS